MQQPTEAEIAKKELKKKQKEVERQAKLAKKAAKDERLAQEAKIRESKEVSPKEKKNKKLEFKETKWEDITTPGNKKNLSFDIQDSYSPPQVESSWYPYWESHGFFNPDTCPNNFDNTPIDSRKKFIMVLPPPNITGVLHLGHALTVAIEDTLHRYYRMNGYLTLWFPGIDHAGIATQAVVEKSLKKENKKRTDFTRKEFVDKVWEWKAKKGNTICEQLRGMGCSLDWSRESFTMNSTLSKAVAEAFHRFNSKNLIYREKKLVNWSSALRTAISDIEVEYIDLEKSTMLAVPGHIEKVEFGIIHKFAYTIENEDTEIVVATTRLETMLGDTAIAVHPDDERYKKYIGKFAIHPFANRKLPIIADPILVDKNFGTGAVKVTPAHDHNDFQCGKRNNLSFINILTDDGKIKDEKDEYSKFAGMMRFDCRREMVEEMKKMNIFRGKENNKMRIGKCSRSGDIIEPLLKPQWYLDCKSMARDAVEAVRNDELKIVPNIHKPTWFTWLEDIHDWCVSRQLWWGHQIPAYLIYLTSKKSDLPSNYGESSKDWVIARTEDEAIEKAKLMFPKHDLSEITIQRDEDVLDTWFSSGLFPFSVCGWPDSTRDLSTYFPGKTHI